MGLNKIINLKIKPIIKRILFVHYKKRINKNKPINGKYYAFKLISYYSENDFKQAKKYNDILNISRLRKKKTIRFAFVVYTSSMWNLDELYHLLTKDKRFKTDIIVAHFSGLDKKAASIEFDNTYNYFLSKKYNIKKINDVYIKKYDILFYLTPFSFNEQKINIDSISLKTLILHTSYSYMIAGNMEKINLWMYHFSYRFYTDSDYYRRLVEQSKLYTGNARFFGFPKMDQYYNMTSNRVIFDKKVVIYAPHHSVNYSKYKSATFEDNYIAILELAKKYNESTYWIYKPHPLLITNSVRAGIFKSVEKYIEYEKQWKNLENGEVVNDGNYFQTFYDSDAMITDSISFLAEYQFSHKPLLLLESGKEEYNDFGKSIINILYKCAGNDIEGIEHFLKNVISNNDTMYNERMRFFEENLDYLKDGKTANLKIYEDIVNFTKE